MGRVGRVSFEYFIFRSEQCLSVNINRSKLYANLSIKKKSCSESVVKLKGLVIRASSHMLRRVISLSGERVWAAVNSDLKKFNTRSISNRQ